MQLRRPLVPPRGEARSDLQIVFALLVRVSPRRFAGVYRATVGQLAKPVLTIAAMLALAYVMNYSGMTLTLGIVLAATGTTFPFFSAILGWLGVFLTGFALKV